MAILAVYELNDFLWNGTRLPTVMGGGASPFYPVQQQPEPSNDLDLRPYITYSVRTRPDTDAWWVSYDTVLYTIWTQSYTKAAEIAKNIEWHLRRMDESATLINDYFLDKPHDHEFLSFRINDVLDPNPTQQEGGQFGKPVSITAMYHPLDLR